MFVAPHEFCEYVRVAPKPTEAVKRFSVQLTAAHPIPWGSSLIKVRALAHRQPPSTFRERCQSEVMQMSALS